MQKLIAIYIVAGLALFGALFAVFAIAGIGRPAATEPETPATTQAASAEPAHPTLEFVPPDLEQGRTYRISHEIPIYQRPDVSSTSEPLPAGGFFTALYTLTDVAGPWTQITVNNGFRDYSMYLLGTDLRWKVLTPIYSDDEQRGQQFEEIVAQLKAAGEQRAAQRALLEAAEEPEVPEEVTFSEWWADRTERMGGPTVANFVVSGAAAAVLTVSIIGAIVMMTLLRREHEWTKPVNPDEDAIDLLPEDEDPFTYSKSGSAFVGNDDEDQRRA